MKLIHLLPAFALSLSLALSPTPARADATGGGPVAHTPDAGADPTDFSITVKAGAGGAAFGVVTADGKVAAGAQLVDFFHGPWGVAFNVLGTLQNGGGARQPVLLRVYLLRDRTDPSTGLPAVQVVVIVFDGMGNTLLRLDGFLEPAGRVTFS